jgi:spermidine/putrescine transport system substrate-binding protein
LKKITQISIIFLIIILILFFTASLLAGCNQTTHKILKIYVWDGYVPEKVADLFKKETGIQLNITLLANNDKMITFLQEGGKADIVMPTLISLNKYYDAGLAQALELNKIPNFEKIFQSFRNQSLIKWDGSQLGYGDIYAIPYIFGTSGLIINTYRYTDSIDNIGWEVLFDTDLKGKVSSRNTIISLLIILDLLGIPGENLVSYTQNTLDNIREKAIELNDNVLRFYNTEDEILNLIENEEVWVSHINDSSGRRLSRSDVKFKYILPESGGLAWADTFMIPKGAENPAGAYLFIDFMLRPEIAAILTEKSGFTTTVKGALGIAEGIDKDLYAFTDEQLIKLKWIPYLLQEERSAYTMFWEELSALQ